MKLQTSLLTMTLLFSVSTSLLGAEVTFKKRQQAGTAGNFKYTYDYKCADGKKKGTVEVQSANDNAARELALLEAKEKCGEE
ncbi:hypothetical protein [Cupriavidus sp. IK-TO18]|uniref:hypothetical protein n=1 Tax=Cupriavidus sp. IK-TO18 TaxID=2782182 RepID=UPI0018994367|nr:hypothetical protein [Cupriavidus sp. IK-TO18]MBF6986495.1 hypothetical protein [Cupriavidus sp. IK-TO18]